MSKILIDGRFVGVGESVSRYTLEVLSGILKLDKENEYTLLIRPQGIEVLNKFFESCGVIPDLISYQKYGTNPENTILDPRVKPEDDKVRAYENLKVKILNIEHYSLGEQTKLLKYLNQEKFDLVHFTQFNHPIRYKGKFVVTIHDLTMLGHLHRQNPIKSFAFGLAMKSAVRKSEKIISVSKTSKKDLLDYYHVPAEKIVVTYLGVDEKYNIGVKNQTSKINEFREEHNIEDQYILYTGMWKKHKNILRMLQAFLKYKLEILNPKPASPAGGSEITASGGIPSGCGTNSKLQNPNIQLVMTGKIDKQEPEVTAHINRINSSLAVILSERSESKDLVQNSIVTTGFVPEEDLPIVYAGASAYIIPSLSEGFGLPPLEAMACGTPVISSKESCMPEILGDAPLYFDPYNVDEIAKAMEKIISDRELRKNAIKKGLEQVKKYDWETTAKETLEVYKSVLE